MRKGFVMCAVFVVIAMLSGCAMIVTRPAKDTAKHKGIRVYPTRVYLIVTETNYTVQLWPDYGQAYDIRPVAILAKNNFAINLAGGQITSVTANLDTTEVAGKLIDAAAKMVPSAEMLMGKSLKLQRPPVNRIGLGVGVYRLSNDGCSWEKMDWGEGCIPWPTPTQ